MQLKRMFSTETAKGSRNYLDTQKKYELLRTILYFAIPISLFVAGRLQLQLKSEEGHQLFVAGFGILANGWLLMGEKTKLVAVGVQAVINGYLQPGETLNLLTIVAVLGCLPASKSAVGAIMFFRFKSCSEQTATEIQRHSEGLDCLYDMVFTSYKRNYVVSHLAVRGGNICGFTEEASSSFGESEFYKHIGDILKMDGHQGVTVKIFTNLSRYTERLEQMKALEAEEDRTRSILATLKSVAL